MPYFSTKSYTFYPFFYSYLWLIYTFTCILNLHFCLPSFVALWTTFYSPLKGFEVHMKYAKRNAMRAHIIFFIFCMEAISCLVIWNYTFQVEILNTWSITLLLFSTLQLCKHILVVVCKTIIIWMEIIVYIKKVRFYSSKICTTILPKK